MKIANAVLAIILVPLLAVAVLNAHACQSAYRDVDGSLDLSAMQLDLDLARGAVLEIAEIYEPIEPDLAARARDFAAGIDVVQLAITALSEGRAGKPDVLAAIDALLAASKDVQWSDDPEKQAHVQAAVAAARVALTIARRTFQ